MDWVQMKAEWNDKPRKASRVAAQREYAGFNFTDLYGDSTDYPTLLKLSIVDRCMLKATDLSTATRVIQTERQDKPYKHHQDRINTNSKEF
ncbi:hypothetical protein [Pseudomonas sp. OA65]|uniref:hypothetical protein n=1 Tax=Pseudomonas sp. OA65 TaxID=2818431 RepID=UPI001A9F47EC|nr:hypothetical protein [Pseudomonas sp. OA65]MBO1539742.1 hypothetical protein [Pseudomonas sp. OA65]